MSDVLDHKKTTEFMLNHKKEDPAIQLDKLNGKLDEIVKLVNNISRKQEERENSSEKHVFAVYIEFPDGKSELDSIWEAPSEAAMRMKILDVLFYGKEKSGDRMPVLLDYDTIRWTKESGLVDANKNVYSKRILYGNTEELYREFAKLSNPNESL